MEQGELVSTVAEAIHCDPDDVQLVVDWLAERDIHLITRTTIHPWGIGAPTYIGSPVLDPTVQRPVLAKDLVADGWRVVKLVAPDPGYDYVEVTEEWTP